MKETTVPTAGPAAATQTVVLAPARDCIGARESGRLPRTRSRLEKATRAGLLAALAFSALAHGAVEAWSAAALQLILLLVLGLWCAKSVRDRRVKAVTPATALPLAALFVLGLAQSIAFTDASGNVVSLSRDVEATRGAVSMLFFLLVGFLAAVNFFGERAPLERLANFLVVFGLALAVFAIVQHLTWDGRLYWVRPSATATGLGGPFVNRNHFAGYMEMLIPIPLALVITRSVGREAGFFYGFAAAVMSTALVLSLSRAGVISLGAGVVFLGLLGGRLARRRRATGVTRRVAAGVLGLSVTAVAAGIFWVGDDSVVRRVAETAGQVQTNSEGGFLNRGWIWKDTWTMIKANPISGVGMGAFQTAYPQYTASDGSAVVAQSHNDYLQILADCGVIGGLIAIWFLVATFRAVGRSLSNRDPLLAALGLGSGAALFAMSVHSVFDFNLQLPSNALLFLVLSGVVARTSEEAEEPSMETEIKASGHKLVLTSLLVLALPLGAWAQERSQAAQPERPRSLSAAPPVLVTSDEDYRIGPRDVLEILIEDAPELTQMYQVSAAGTFLMPYLGRIQAQGLSTEELAKKITEGLRGRYLKTPNVSVVVKQYNSRSFFIQGAVRAPGVYQIEGAASLLKLVILAGGLAENHGAMAFIIREVRTQTGVEGEDYQLIKVNINGLLTGHFEQNTLIQPGDVVNIPQLDTFYVAGEVTAPGAYPLKPGTTLRQAISLARGTTFSAAKDRGVIFRDDPQTGKREDLKVDIGAIMSGKKEDLQIQANDIIIVPNSRMKSMGAALLSAFSFGVVRNTSPVRY